MTELVASLAIPGSIGSAVQGSNAQAARPAVLEEFLVGPENRLAQVAIEIVLEGGNPDFNPIVLCGPPGVGKSHLALGLVSALRLRQRQRHTLYVTAIDFARELNDAIDTQSVEDFRQRYRQASLLAVDDVDLLADKPAAQRELVSTFDALTMTGGRLVATCSKPPEQLVELLPTLLSRLVSGLSVPLAVPGGEARLAYLMRLAETREIELGESEAELLAAELELPLPGLSGALAQLELAAQADGGRITEQTIRKYLAERENPRSPTLSEIANATARHFSLKVADLRSPSRRRTVVTARDVAMYLARTLSGKSLKQIGKYFAGRDHTTVSHGCLKAERLLQTDPAIREAVQQLRERLMPGPTAGKEVA